MNKIDNLMATLEKEGFLAVLRDKYGIDNELRSIVGDKKFIDSLLDALWLEEISLKLSSFKWTDCID